MTTETLTRDYRCTITVPAAPRLVFENISNVSAWWTTHFDGSAGRLNDIFTVHFGDTFVTFLVTGFQPWSSITWLVTDCHLPWLKDKKEWNNTKVVWEITPNGDASLIDMTHIGLEPGIECYDGCEKGWNFCIKESLFKLVTEGKGLPK